MDRPGAPDGATQALLDRLPCGLVRTDTDGSILWVNETFCRWTDRRREALLGHRLPELLTAGGRIFHQTHLAPLLQMQGSVSEVKLDLVRPDGVAIPMVLNAQRHGEGDRRFTEIALFVARDRDKYERELVQARKRLEALLSEGHARQEEARDRAEIAEQMVGIVSHDLRSPLQTIQMGAVLLARDATARQQAVVGRIARAGERAQRLIADLLDFTQARLGRGLGIQPRPMDLHEGVAEVVEELALAFPGRELVHEREGDGECVADPDRLAQLVGNLVGNAMAYGSPDAPVTVRSVIGPDEFRLLVHNAGEPIPPHTQAALFRPLVRGTAGGAARSVGLGLFIVGEIAKAHGGTVSVASSVQEGTTFTATLPRRG